MAESAEAIELPPQLKRSIRYFWRASGHSNVKRLTREIYHRTDIGCGIDSCTTCTRSSHQGTLEGNQTILILTVNVLMKQITFCERCLTNCVIPATVANEVRRRSLTIYARMKKMLLAARNATDDDIEMVDEQLGTSPRRYYIFSNENFEATYVEETGEVSPEERDELLIEKCAQWYREHLPPTTRVILLRNNCTGGVDEEKADATDASGVANISDDESKPLLERMTVDEWAHELEPTIKDVFEYIAAKPDDETRKRRRTDDDYDALYPAHLTESEMHDGIESGKYHRGVLHMYVGSFQNGYVICGNEEYKITGSDNLNRAIHGDSVCIEVITEPKPSKNVDDTRGAGSFIPEEITGEESEDSKLIDSSKDDKTPECIQKECRVVGILRRNWREYCGTLIPLDETIDLVGHTNVVQRVFVPVDARIPFIFIDTRKSSELDGKRIVVVVDGWDRFSLKPYGHWVDTLGDVEDMETESAVILREHDVITREFSERVCKELPPADWKPDEDEIARRADFRNLLVFSVDPPGCKDIDDALGYRKLDNGNIEVSVHIADVTHFVKPGSRLDMEASERCTTVYLVDRRTDMLPSLLTTNLCSLVANEDRLCFSVVWEFDENDTICDTRFVKGIIRSARAFTYKDAQDLINADGSDEITRALKGLDRLAKILRSKRFERGAVELESPDVKFEYELTDIRKMEKYVLYDTNRMVEEFMLLANVSVATKIFERFPTYALLRRHPPPVEERLKALQRSLSQHGLDFEFGTSRDLNSSLRRIMDLSDPKLGSALRILTTRCMSQAVYCYSGDTDARDFRHYGLCSDLYTHFTSPIRRYADVVVHRMLAAALGIEHMDTAFFHKLSSQCETLNKRHRNANWCGRESSKLFAYLFLRQQGSVTTTATVVGSSSKRICVLAHDLGIEATASADIVDFDAPTQCVTLACGRRVKLFDHVTVKLSASNKHYRYNITAELL
ncbi:Exosome complex exonuclease RRP44 [Babesia sp. Xinjiang]|uniref:Exosome complex exonuclease RRP44 n=1 Tax=Babesia sp. Xinjiang TaxID=462227 RepID=UPI000A23C244|nr:Exosome complex exonuclease RRP44 [Babesia sp. Xinjiang]XP_028871623.1 Exosome complex exonuclease RRP44 [Babesia sp. Xinjiang]ORM41162.1 Exosome complex exonuclease RRP44 [Babesia sp. Xinjiang]ORM41167.1 Exosome complex exonuclease RRP44 [Babesia sp. Xinjiang]